MSNQPVNHVAKDADNVATLEGLQYHLKVKPGDLADIVLFPGDLRRVERIAKQWDSNEKVAEYRQYISYKGKFKNHDISAVSSGIGPSACEIALAELKNIGTKYIIRVGSCGALQPDINIGDLVISEAAVRLEDTSHHYTMKEFPAYASRMLTSALIRACEENNLPYHVGITASSSSFYVGQGRKGWNNYLPSFRENLVKDLTMAGVKNFEMEASLMFVLGSLYGMETSAVCAVYANRATNEFAVKGEDIAIKAANEAARIVFDYIEEKGSRRYWF
ncbi:MAG: nucleoside phosphorylase [Candidatus Heimdallarchaeota archaeon]|nr:nucleoside phosphorylase [Candidatus Heimdallarchaeota archaeon]MDH5645133.1 nucleoside phosphorylase [Candidatus Heimdallarchaeota archaeon]